MVAESRRANDATEVAFSFVQMRGARERKGLFLPLRLFFDARQPEAPLQFV
jgi:hypothetical protein